MAYTKNVSINNSYLTDWFNVCNAKSAINLTCQSHLLVTIIHIKRFIQRTSNELLFSF